jgi:hypothetical protein
LRHQPEHLGLARRERAEYGSGMIRTSIAAAPQRLTGLLAKAVVVGGVVLGTAVVSVAGSLCAGRLIPPGKGLTTANGSALSAAAGNCV